MTYDLEKYLLEAEGKDKSELALGNPYREIGFDQDKQRLGWVRVYDFTKIKESLNNLSSITDGKKYFIFVGIGGSINGIKALLGIFKNPAFFTLDSLDPEALKDVTGRISIDETLVIPISKSGTTLETQLLAWTLRELFADKWQEHFLWLTDPTSFEKLDSLGWNGVKTAIQFDQGIDIGGRFSSPNTLIFFLPLYLLLKRDFKKLEKIYKNYLCLQGKVRKKAYALSVSCGRKRQAYFYPTVERKLGDKFSSWIVQLFQESLGSKNANLSAKTLDFSPRVSGNFMPLRFELKVSNPVVAVMAEMYFFEVFIAFYSALKRVNFVTQDFVEHYKVQMRKLENQPEEKTEEASLKKIIACLRKKHIGNFRFIEVVLYCYADKTTARGIKRLFQKAFPDKIVFMFTGSDWNHHSYQAAFGDSETFYLFLIPPSYTINIKPFRRYTLKKNVKMLKIISKATHLTLKDKSLLFSFSKT